MENGSHAPRSCDGLRAGVANGDRLGPWRRRDRRPFGGGGPRASLCRLAADGLASGHRRAGGPGGCRVSQASARPPCGCVACPGALPRDRPARRWTTARQGIARPSPGLMTQEVSAATLPTGAASRCPMVSSLPARTAPAPAHPEDTRPPMTPVRRHPRPTSIVVQASRLHLSRQAFRLRHVEQAFRLRFSMQAGCLHRKESLHRPRRRTLERRRPADRLPSRRGGSS